MSAGGTPARVATFAAVVVAALLAPQVLTGSVAQNLAVLSLLYAVVASNWDLTLGYAGIFNFAHVAFFGLGTYVAAVSTVQFGMPVWWDLALAAVVVAAVGAGVAALALRLRGIYVALVTFALTQLCVALINSQKDLTGGPVGLVGVPDLQIGDFALGNDPRAYIYLSEFLLIGSTLMLRWLTTSSFGLSLVALRDNEPYAISRGIPATRQRVLAIVASSVPTSLAGGIYAHYLVVASPDVFSFSLSTLLLSMVLVGGAATTYGPILAAIVLTVGTEELAGLGNVRYMIVAVLIVLVLRFLPGGVWSAWRRIAARRTRAGRSRSVLRRRGTRMTVPFWPEGRRAAVSFTFDFDAESVWLAIDPANAERPGVLSVGRYGAKVAMPLLLDLLARHKVHATFFVVGRNAELYPDRVAAILAGGHEIAVHGYTHTPPAKLSPAAEEAELVKARTLLEAAGATVTGYRSPAWEVSPVTLDLLEKHGFGYSSQFMDDIRPYRHPHRPLVELPIQWLLDDWPHFQFAPGQMERPVQTTGAVETLWREEMDGIVALGGHAVLTMHPQVIGRPSRLALLDRLLATYTAQPDIWIATCGDVARHADRRLASRTTGASA